MGDIGDELLLIVFHIFELCCHIVERGRQIAHLVFCPYRDLISQIAGGILGGSLCDLPQRLVNEKVECQQDAERCV